VNLANCTIQNWKGNGVFVGPRGGVWINGGTITSNTEAGLLVNGGQALLGDGPNGQAGNPVTISSNGTGITILAGGSATVVNGSIENNTNDGVDVTDRSSIVFSTDGGAGTAITGNGGHGVLVAQGSNLTLGSGTVSNNGEYGIKLNYGSTGSIGSNITSGAAGTATQITGNGYGGVIGNLSTITIDGATITGNTGGPAVQADGGAAIIKTATLSSVSGQPTILGYGAGLGLFSDTVNGPTNASTLVALAGSKVTLQSSIITANDPHDPTVLSADGSTLDSFGGNTICTGTLGGGCTAAPGGIAITVANDSTFRQVSAANLFGQMAPASDTIIGGGTVQVQSNMELGTGASVPSTWTGAITVQQNSSFRLDGGISISGGVSLIQGSNGFFNKSATGTNAVTVTCAGTNSSHVAGASFVSPVVTLVTTGVGCYAF
jgi:hypothetical protein